MKNKLVSHSVFFTTQAIDFGFADVDYPPNMTPERPSTITEETEHSISKKSSIVPSTKTSLSSNESKSLDRNHARDQNREVLISASDEGKTITVVIFQFLGKLQIYHN